MIRATRYKHAAAGLAIFLQCQHGDLWVVHALAHHHETLKSSSTVKPQEVHTVPKTVQVHCIHALNYALHGHHFSRCIQHLRGTYLGSFRLEKQLPIGYQ